MVCKYMKIETEEKKILKEERKEESQYLQTSARTASLQILSNSLPLNNLNLYSLVTESAVKQPRRRSSGKN
jgi:hypothetical protein